MVAYKETKDVHRQGNRVQMSTYLMAEDRDKLIAICKREDRSLSNMLKVMINKYYEGNH